MTDRPSWSRDGPSWSRDGNDWPNREASLFVRAGGLDWHVMRAGAGPVLLLLHGTGAATHSWRGLLPLLTRHFTVIAPDLPGHGFTAMPPARLMTLPDMARLLDALLRALDVRVSLAAGHSAGAAILARLCLDGRIAPAAMMSLNGALLPLAGAQSDLFPAIARLLVRARPVPRIVAWRAGNSSAVERLLQNTGSTIDTTGRELYARLMRTPGHVAGALAMMGQWDLRPLLRDLPKLRLPVTLVVGGNDRMIPPDDAMRLCTILPDATLVTLPGLGHLAHEERPGEVAALIEAMAERRLAARRVLHPS